MGTSEGARKQWQDPVSRARKIAGIRAAWADPDVRRRIEDGLHAAAPRISETMRQRYQDDPSIAQRLSERSKERWADPTSQMHKVPGTPVRRSKQSEALKQWWANATDEQRAARQEKCREGLAKGRKKIKGGHFITGGEGTIMEVLNDLECAYLVHKMVGSYVVDVLVPAQRLVIEYDGSWWHADEKRRAHDAERDDFMSRQGYTVLRIAEDTPRDKIHEDIAAAIEGAVISGQ